MITAPQSDTGQKSPSCFNQPAPSKTAAVGAPNGLYNAQRGNLSLPLDAAARFLIASTTERYRSVREPFAIRTDRIHPARPGVLPLAVGASLAGGASELRARLAMLLAQQPW